jgi:hypothetical protein
MRELPGTHLVETPCVYCGIPVLAVPARVRYATCAGCGREELGAYPPPHTPFPRVQRTRREARIIAAEDDLPFTVVCENCEWTRRVATADETVLVLLFHDLLTHNPKGWLSGVRGGRRR